jgi:hypothetical protein
VRASSVRDEDLITVEVHRSIFQSHCLIEFQLPVFFRQRGSFFGKGAFFYELIKKHHDTKGARGASQNAFISDAHTDSTDKKWLSLCKKKLKNMRARSVV